MQQMPGRDAYLDGLLVFATRAHARGGRDAAKANAGVPQFESQDPCA